jgi:hypothetical protein
VAVYFFSLLDVLQPLLDDETATAAPASILLLREYAQRLGRIVSVGKVVAPFLYVHSIPLVELP